MTSTYPITPPPVLVQQWLNEVDEGNIFGEHLAARAAQWGADQELLACGNYLKQCAAWEEEDVIEFYNDRRPKPPSLKEQALDRCNDYIDPDGIIRRALEALPDD